MTMSRSPKVHDSHGVSRRVFLGALGAAAVAPRGFAQGGPPIPVTSINHMTINVTDPARSLKW